MADAAQEWLALLEAERAARQTQREWDAREGERAATALMAKLSLMADRLAIPEYAPLAAELAAAPDQAALDAIRVRNDLSPAEAVALLMLVSGGGAAKLLRHYAKHASSARHPEPL